MAHLTACDSTWQQDAISSKLLHKVLFVYSCKSTCAHFEWPPTGTLLIIILFYVSSFVCYQGGTCLENARNYWVTFLVDCLFCAVKSVLCSGAHSEDMQVSHRDSSQQSLLWRCCSASVSGYMQVILDVFSVTMIRPLNHAEFAKTKCSQMGLSVK